MGQAFSTPAVGSTKSPLQRWSHHTAQCCMAVPLLEALGNGGGQAGTTAQPSPA